MKVWGASRRALGSSELCSAMHPRTCRLVESPGWKSTGSPRSFLHRKTCEVEDMLRPRLPTVCALTGSPLTARQIMHIGVEHPQKRAPPTWARFLGLGSKEVGGFESDSGAGIKGFRAQHETPRTTPSLHFLPPFRSFSRTSSYKPSIWRGISTLLPVCSKTDAFRHSTLTPCPFLLKYAAARQNTFRSRLSKRAP